MTEVDLDLLPHLEVLLNTQSVTAAAERQGLSVPAMSRILGKLRDRLGDPLLVRAGNRMVLTPRALHLRKELAPTLGKLRTLMLSGDSERPALLRPFRVRTSDAVPALLARSLLEALQERVSGAALVFVPEGEESVDALREGDVDLDIGVQDDESTELMVQGLFRERLVAVVARDSGLAAPLSLEALCSLPHVAVSRTGKARGPLDDALSSLGLEREVKFVVPGYLDAALLVSEGGLLTLLPRQLVLRVGARLGLSCLEPPLPLPKLRVAQAWHRRMQDDRAHRELREAVARLATAYRDS